MQQIDGPRLPPAGGGRARSLVILAHGYGSNGDDLIGLAPFWARSLPDTAFVSPHAPEPVPGFPSGRQWFPISRLDPRQLAAGAARSGAVLDGFIDAELRRHALPPAACALVGFSQGTMMSLHVGLRRREPLAAIVGYSGALVGGETLASDIRSRPPILLAHGDADEMVPIDALFAAQAALAVASSPVQVQISPGLGHSIAEEGLATGGRFLADAFAGRFAGWAAPSPFPARG